uniref:Uncharacterized protein n=1 Tax=Anguilla anguilla TaxID=7936 RepID=A0A0E9XDV5_ANGAN
MEVIGQALLCQQPVPLLS